MLYSEDCAQVGIKGVRYFTIAIPYWDSERDRRHSKTNSVQKRRGLTATENECRRIQAIFLITERFYFDSENREQCVQCPAHHSSLNLNRKECIRHWDRVKSEISLLGFGARVSAACVTSYEWCET